MTYTQITVIAVGLAIAFDLWGVRTRVITRKAFWVSYAIIVFFQFITNAMFTGFGIVQYDGAAIIGSTSPTEGPPAFLGDGRIAFAPMEDLGFGFALILLTLSMWVWLGRKDVQPTPLSGPPMWRKVTQQKD
jgi:hypothetical protein